MSSRSSQRGRGRGRGRRGRAPPSRTVRAPASGSEGDSSAAEEAARERLSQLTLDPELLRRAEERADRALEVAGLGRFDDHVTSPTVVATDEAASSAAREARELDDLLGDYQASMTSTAEGDFLALRRRAAAYTADSGQQQAEIDAILGMAEGDDPFTFGDDTARRTTTTVQPITTAENTADLIGPGVPVASVRGYTAGGGTAGVSISAATPEFARQAGFGNEAAYAVDSASAAGRIAQLRRAPAEIPVPATLSYALLDEQTSAFVENTTVGGVVSVLSALHANSMARYVGGHHQDVRIFFANPGVRLVIPDVLALYSAEANLLGGSLGLGMSYDTTLVNQLKLKRTRVGRPLTQEEFLSLAEQ